MASLVSFGCFMNIGFPAEKVCRTFSVETSTNSETGVDGVRILPPVYGPVRAESENPTTYETPTNSETGSCQEEALAPVLPWV